MEQQDIKKTKELIQETKNLVITCHKNPDGDAIGSSLALLNYFITKGISTTVVVPNNYPEFLKWLPKNETIVVFDEQEKEAITIIEQADLIFSLDYNALHRTGAMQTVLENANANFIMIDHHQQPESFASVTYSDTSICSTCQMVYHFIEYIDHIDAITPEIGQCIYTGIMTDTGSFRFRSTTSTTHKVIAQLIDLGVDNAQIHQNVYDTNSQNRLLLLGRSLSNLKVISDYHTAYISLSSEDLLEFNTQKGDTEGVVNYALSLKGIKLAVLFKEDLEQGIVKMSFRSKGTFSVNDLARTHFNGGGHINAAGGISLLSFTETIDKFISILPQYKNQLT